MTAVPLTDSPAPNLALLLIDGGIDVPDLPGMPLLVLTRAGKIAAINDAYCRLLGRKRSEIVGRHPLSFTHPEDQGDTVAQFSSFAAEDRNETAFEKRYLRGDGTTVWVHLTATSIPGRDLILSHVVDISDLVTARAETQSARARLSALVEHSTNPIFVIAADGRLSDANPATVALFGPREGDTVSDIAADHVHPDDLSLVMRTLADAWSHPGTHPPLTFRMTDIHGEAIHIEAVSDNQLHNPAIRGLVINARDVTEPVYHLQQVKRGFENLVTTLGRSGESRDPYTAGHQNRVAHLAAAIATQMNCDPDMVEGIGFGAAIHDIGKNAIPAELLAYAGKLSAAAFELIKTHSQIGHDIVADIDFPWPIADIVLQHHERLDGSGYPNALAGDAILTEARIVAVADVTEAISAHRPYRPALGIDVALAELTRGRGTLYDPDAVDACITLFTEQQFTFK